MDSVQIGSYLAADSLRRRLFYELDILRGRGLHISVRCRDLGDLATIECIVKEDRGSGMHGNDLRTALRRSVASAVSGLIFEELEEALLVDTLKSRHPELSGDEALAVSGYAETILNEGILGVLDPVMRSHEVAADVEACLSDCSMLVVEGYVRFRMKEYMEEVQRSADEALARFMADREHREFVRLLKYFVDLQEQREDEVHVVRLPNGGFELLGQDGAEVNGEYMGTLAADLLDEGVEMADLLISALMTVSPGRIVLHFNPDESVADMLASVFEGKVEVCQGCRLSACQVRAAEKSASDELPVPKQDAMTKQALGPGAVDEHGDGMGL
ncbi:MAG: putative sporulation protein YtxC [Clostridia bacterium]|nr:putative sporulation protein YtxC [Clostridia bacterium]